MDAVHNRTGAVKLAVLVSGGGTNLQALIDRERNTPDGAPCPFRIELVVSSSPSAFALERAAKAGIRTETVTPSSVLGEKAASASKEEKRRAVSDRILELLRRENIAGVVLAGFLTVLRGPLVEVYAGRIINLHPALLPKFGGFGMWGRHVHEAVLAAGETESGCTIHYADGGCDTGAILLQKRVPVNPGDTPETLAARIAVQEHQAVVEGAELLAEKIAREESVPGV